MQNLQTTNKQLQVLKTQLSQSLPTLQAKSISDCINSPYGSINKLKREGVEVKAVVVYFIADLVEVFNFGKGMNTLQISALCDALIEKFWNYSPEDFKRCCQNIKECKYIEKFYESIDESKIHYCFNKYDEERENEIVSLRMRENSERKSEMKEPLLGTSVNEKFLEFANKLITKNKPEIKRERTEQEKVLDGFIAEFDALFSQQDKGSGGQRFVEYKSKMYNIDTFCNLRYAEENK